MIDSKLVTEEVGDIVTADVDVIMHQVNCSNAMGSGVALSILNEYPIVKEEFHKFSEALDKEERLGKCQIIKVDKHKWVVNLFGQLDYGNGRLNGRVYTNYDALQKSLDEAFAALEGEGLIVVIPKYMGCGLAGGDWDTVNNMIHHVANKYGVRVKIVQYSAGSKG